MLEYENEMFLEILHEDGLVITAKGLGIETVFVNILKVYLDPGNLVIVLGTTDHDEKYFIDKLQDLGIKNLPRIVTGQCTSNERELMYLEGGILFIPGRILVVDLLKNRVPLNLVTGILVYKAHNILRSYQEAFAVRLYRQTNKTGFIKAFSNSALSFTFGFSNVERVMKTLFVKKLYLWPRFHTIVNNSLSKLKPEVLEFHVKITTKMLHIQTALLDAMNYVVKELKRINKYLDLEELTVENAIAKKFHKQLQSQLDPVWHQLSTTTKQLLSDLKTLRGLLMSLTYKDCVSFYSTLNSLRTMDYAMQSSGWLMLDAVENLFKYAKERVYSDKNELKPEPNPKWVALSEVLHEIQRDKKKEDNENPEKVLVLVHDRQTCYQLKKFLTMGANEYLLNEALKKLQHDNLHKSNNIAENNEKSVSMTESDKDEEIMDTQDSYVLTLSQKAVTESQSTDPENEYNETLFEECSQIAELDLTTITTTAPIVIVQSLKKDGDPMALQRTLKESKPSNVIMYVADIAAVRQLEIYQNNNPSINLKVYFLIYGGSVEEQEYLTALRREKEAFHVLINTKKTMVIPEDQDGKSEDCLTFATQSDNEMEQNTRKGDQESQKNIINKVIVDMREFNSELPSILHSRGIHIEPVTLAIGDYILSPEICIERKSVSDLIGSLNTGRLYNQAVAMTRHYSKPMLLIEFDQNKPFCFQGCYYMGKDVKSFAITSKLQLLTLHFPKLKFVWSPSPHASAQLFEELKSGRDQPSAEKAITIGVNENAEDEQLMIQKYNPHIQDFIAKLPGVHSKNLCAILNQGKSLNHLIKFTEDELAEIIGNKSDAQMLYNSIHNKCGPDEETDIKSIGGRKVPKGRGKKLFSKIKQ
ncbi:DNA repair endonuclease XPF isoform X1 [Vespula squamosa]|uniref:DNA repair endonuclease XPF n=1 Tax=Vespula squamosa TaxID=30214 RepID=A0ABD1ZXH7_VESSQ